MEPLGRRQALLPIRYCHGDLVRRRVFILREHTFAELDYFAQLHQDQVKCAVELSAAVQDRTDTTGATEAVRESAARLYAWLLRHPERGRGPGLRWVDRHVTTGMRRRIVAVQDELNGFSQGAAAAGGAAAAAPGAPSESLPTWDEVLERLAARWGVTPVHVYETLTPRQAARLLPHVERGWWRELTGLRAAQHAAKWEEPRWTHVAGAGGREDEVKRKIEEQKRLQAEAKARGKLKWDPQGGT